MSQPEYRIITARNNPELVKGTIPRINREWPEFMLHDTASAFLDACYTELPDFQFVLTESGCELPVAIGNSIPLHWTQAMEKLPDEGWDWAITTGIKAHREGIRPTVLCALQIVVFSGHQGKGISRRAVQAMIQRAREAGLNGLIAPVRPNRKCDYPLISIEEYLTWIDVNGLFFDPWLRVHQSLGARLIRPCRKAMRITGTVAEWEKWTGRSFPKSGTYEIPGALVPVTIDRVADIGTYVEPNVWMHHSPA